MPAKARNLIKVGATPLEDDESVFTSKAAVHRHQHDELRAGKKVPFGTDTS